MLDRDVALAMVQEAYAARVRGDKNGLERYWAANATFEISGDREQLREISLDAPDPMTTISALIDRFTFSDLKMLDAVIDGRSMAIRWAVTMSVATKPPVDTQLFDLIKLNDEGKIQSFVQFADTALIRHLVA